MRRFFSPYNCVKRRLAAFFACLTLGGVLLPLGGCNLANGFTGGGVPIGKLRLSGRVVLAEQPNSPLANARVNVFQFSREKATYSFNLMTDSQGRFDFTELPSGSHSNTLQVAITPPSSQFRTQTLNFTLLPNQSAYLIATVAKTSYNVDQGVGLEVYPHNISVQSNNNAKITAKVLDVNGDVLNVTPTMLFIGNFTEVRPDGSVVTGAEGEASVYVYWYGNLQSSTNIHISDTGIPYPPGPP